MTKDFLTIDQHVAKAEAVRKRAEAFNAECDACPKCRKHRECGAGTRCRKHDEKWLAVFGCAAEIERQRGGR